MTEWNDGYVSDIAYSGAVYREQMPAHLDVACLAAGAAPPVEPGAAFSYCELGCGLGDTAMSVAAAYPDARVWGFDFNPAHIADGAHRAARAGLDNLVLAEHAFEELASGAVALPPFDYVTMHGVWSWVSAANKAHIVAFLRRYLRPGGLFCITYNAMPGWAPMVPLQHLLLNAGRAVGGTSDRRIGEAVGLARRVLDMGSPSIPAATLEGVERALKAGQVPYLSHEYLNEHWQPAFFADVAAALAPAKLSYVASANILENFPALCMTPEQRAFVDRLSPELRQTVADYFCPRSFRRDIFVRGPRRPPARAYDARLAAQGLALGLPAGAVRLTLDVPVGQATLSAPFYGPVLERLKRGNATVGQLVAAADPETVPALNEIAAMLVGGRQVLPAIREAGPAELERVRRYNRAQAEITCEAGQPGGWLVGANIGTVIRVGVLELLAYEAILDAEAATGAPATEADAPAVRDRIRTLLDVRRIALRQRPGGEPEKAAEAEPLDLDAELPEILTEFLPVWRRLGVL
ncbi:class I SAM-dependent methyltransferase [Methylobacterium sp. NEAU 140]|uniref:class I SAM-dependent methyltransferase n=1 Tax=Methylobacterium sp. NEAU 140 TaxID=3064945 RepID=UPI0027356D08|nr:class I SAM-dependent methyltransferase [Methylobacterium sp. NEAU 140]MDP4025117.1 class I SAM-dependent methyltransferase [Methylobacterium sp. NEAU 140]